MYEFASSSATLLTVYTAVMHTRRMNVIPEAELWNYDRGGGRSLRCTVVLLRLNSTTRPDRTRADFFARPGPQTRVSDEVRGLCLVGSRRARVVEFSYYALLLLHITHLFLINH